MNKKGLILIFLFVVSAFGVMFVGQADTNDKVEVTLQYIPSAYVPMGEVYVEFDSRFLDDNMVFGEDDIIHFAFFYDVAVETWGGATTTGGGVQPEYWFYETPSPYIVPDPENPAQNVTYMYTETRFIGTFNVMVDYYDIGMTNFDIWADDGTYQEIAVQLEKGWHTMTIVAAELVSDYNHTTWEWQYVKDQKRFYISDDKEDTAPLIGDALYNEIALTTTAVNSEDLNSYYVWDSFLASPRPKAEATENQYAEVELGNATTTVVTDIAVQYNASNNVLTLADGALGCVYDNIYEMGPLTYMWIVNDGDMLVANASSWEDPYEPTVLTEGLRVGQNYIYFVLFGFRVDDYSQYLGDYFGIPTAAPQLACSVVRYDIWIGDLPEEPEEVDPCADCPCPEPTPGFGIFISVSMLGLAAVIVLLRRRK